MGCSGGDLSGLSKGNACSVVTTHLSLLNKCMTPLDGQAGAWAPGQALTFSSHKAGCCYCVSFPFLEHLWELREHLTLFKNMASGSNQWTYRGQTWFPQKSSGWSAVCSCDDSFYSSVIEALARYQGEQGSWPRLHRVCVRHRLG